ncbi:ferredoxin:protochlorophyllide reductase (ATP-dependent) subunit B [Methylobacterium radiodurans]|uniref:Light-independent protochlorophyllide reductase subunit B n=1 Tax=Methylobacterium radiodurans TaxID=2202828 RepID=A0A2U8VUC6_9HYPH|nr:ferredoxin:protochlorophyllide reductase (ATP-dependent) subunit B [Methylobacterium radiodurans]AWN37384.1 ferredoxin:protochlorophyllide reductase (ATP-dependent) subunit B [Methylobacterium radiodurans]
MQLTLWTYEGPPHIGALRVATAMRGLHYVLHAPQGDTYADLLFTMIERRDRRPPVTYTTFRAEDLGRDTAALFKQAVSDAYERFRPEAIIVGASCTAELIQDDPGGLARALGLPVPVIGLELPAYQKKENWGASETFYRLVRALSGARRDTPAEPRLCNILGPTALGFRHRDDLVEVRRILDQLGIRVNVVAPLGASPGDLGRLPEAAFNVVLYPEIGRAAAQYLEKAHGQPFCEIPPIGVGATRDFIAAVAALAGVDPAPARDAADSRLPWYARSVDSTYLTDKRVFVFGDAAHAVALARVAAREIGFRVVGLGTYERGFSREVRAEAAAHGIEALIADDYLDVEAAIQAAAPDLVLGTQMERHVAKRLGIPCAVISAPAHVQDYPARHSPLMGFEGANVLFDTLVHPLMMGLEEHLLGLFREDREFHADAAPSHLRARSLRADLPPPSAGEGGPRVSEGRSGRSPAERGPQRKEGAAPVMEVALTPEAGFPSPDPLRGPPSPAEGGGKAVVAAASSIWAPEAERELKKIPFFVRGRARTNTETFARERAIPLITVETLYDAKAHFSR